MSTTHLYYLLSFLPPRRSFHRNGIIQLAFSPDGKMLCTIGNDPHHTVCVFQWAENRVLFSSHVDRVSDVVGFARNHLFKLVGRRGIYDLVKLSVAIYSPVCLSICRSVCLSVCLFCLPACLSACPACLPTCLSVCLFAICFALFTTG